MQRHRHFGLILAAFAVLVLTPDALFMRLSGMTAPAMLAWRGLLMGTVLLLAWALLTTDRRGALAAGTGIAGATVVACQAVNQFMFSHGIAHAPVPVVLFGVAAVPAFAAIFARVIIKEPTRPSTWAAIVAVGCGIGISVFGDGAGIAVLEVRTLLGALAGLTVAGTLALSFVTIRANPAVPILPCIGVGAILAGLTGLALAGPAGVLEGSVWAIAITGAVILPVSFFSLSLASRHTHAANVSLLLLLETILGPAWVWLGTGEVPTPAMVVGGTIVVVSLAAYLFHTGRSPVPQS